MKAYYVEIVYGGFVAATDSMHADTIAEQYAWQISRDDDPLAIDSEEIQSIKQMQSICPFFATYPIYGAGKLTLLDLIPPDAPPKDTMTIDMFDSEVKK